MEGIVWASPDRTRFGEIPNIVGTKMIPTTYLITPKSAGTIFAITGLNFTQLLPLKAKGDAIAFGAGKYMGFDGADSPFNGGGGHTTFLHLAFNGTPTNGHGEATARSVGRRVHAGWRQFQVSGAGQAVQSQ